MGKIKMQKWWDNQGITGVPLEVFLERWKAQYDDVPTLEFLKEAYPEVPETSLKSFRERIFA